MLAAEQQSAEETRTKRLGEIQRELRDLGYRVYFQNLGEMVVVDEGSEINTLRDAVHGLGWAIHTEQRAFTYTIFAYRMFYGERQVAGPIVKDLGVSPEQANGFRLDAWQGVSQAEADKRNTELSDEVRQFSEGCKPEPGLLTLVQAYMEEEKTFVRPERTVGQELLWAHPQGIVSAVKILELQENNWAKVEIQSSPLMEVGAAIPVPLCQTATTQEFKDAAARQAAKLKESQQS